MPAWLVDAAEPAHAGSSATSGPNATQAMARAQGATDVDDGRRDGRRASSTRAATAACSQARGLVGVRGAGFSYDGFCYVKKVTHKISLGRVQAALRARARGPRLDDPGGAAMSAFFGKYRGKVENNVDPLQQGRVQVSVPGGARRRAAQLGDAVRAVRRLQVGLFVVPPVGANVWVEFEGGDPDYPIWTGCFWGLGEVPGAAGARRDEGPQDRRRDARARATCPAPAG